MNKNHAMPFALIAAFAAVIYLPTINYSFHLDDFHYITENPAIKSFLPWEPLTAFPSRAVAFFSFYLNYHITGLAPWGFRLTNILLHLLTAVMVFLLAKKLTDSEDMTLPLFTALIFTAHPLQTQAVVYVYQRTAILGALFYISTLYFYADWRKTDSSRSRNLSFLFALLAFFSKETAYTLPFTILACEAVFFSGIKQGLRRMTPYLLCAIPALAALALSDTSVDIKKLSGESYGPTPWQYFLTQPAVVLKYIRLFFLPYGQQLLYDIKPASALSALPWFAAITALGAAALYAARKNKTAFFGILFFFITLSIESSVIPLQDFIFEHRMYLPLFGLALAAASALAAIPLRWQRIASVTGFIIIFMLSAAAGMRARVWKDEITLWTDNVRKAPDNAYTHNNLGAAYVQEGRLTEGLAQFKDTVRLKPDYSPAYSNIGSLLAMNAQYDEAEKYFLMALKHNPDADRVLVNLGRLNQLRGKKNTALGYYKEAAAFNQKNPIPYFLAGTITAEAGYCPQARNLFRTAAKLEPENKTFAAFAAQECKK